MLARTFNEITPRCYLNPLLISIRVLIRGFFVGEIMNIPDMSKLRERLLAEIEGVQNGTSSINQAKVVSNLANGVINSWLVEIAATKATPDNHQKEIERDYIDG